MVVDDEPDLLRIVEKYLNIWRFETEGFVDPKEALTAFHRDPSRYSLILSDIMMPGISGIELARDVFSIKPGMKLVLMSAYEVNDEMLGAIPMMHPNILKKPFRLAEICESVKAQLKVAY